MVYCNCFYQVYLSWRGKISGIVILLGPKHAGKTAAGLVLARALGVPFTDLDALVETQTGKSPRSLYREGPGVFREAETRALESLLAPRPSGPAAPRGTGGITLTAAAGGGIIDNRGAAALLETAPGLILVALEVSAETSWKRIQAGAQKTGELPPFLNTENPRETLLGLHERRTAAYRDLARFVIPGDGKPPEEIAREILEKLKPYMSPGIAEAAQS